MLARCPHCRTTFSTERSGHQQCPACGKALVVPEPSPAVLAAVPETESPQGEPGGTPWERRHELGFFRAWKETMLGALFEPTALFASARLDRGSAHLGFAVFTTSLFWSIGQILERAVMGSQREQMRKLLGSLSDNPDLGPLLQKMVDTSAQANSWGWVLFLALFTPVFSFLLIYLNAAVTHGFALVLGQAKRGFAGTFAACAYSCAPLALMAIPACGSIIGVIWLVVLTGVGMKITHRISSGGAAATVLAPYLLFCCLTLVGGTAMVMAMRNAMGGP